LAGKADFLLPGLVAGSRGVISALANIVPKVHVEVVRLYNSGELQKAQEIQAKLSIADWALMKTGVSGVKAVNVKWFGYGNSRARKPLPQVEPAGIQTDIASALQAVIDLEMQLPSAKF
jgi:2-keto-3-deoxy-L-rhamnonate aldolase